MTKLCIKDFAKLYGVSPSTVRRWIQRKKVKWEQPAGKNGMIFIEIKKPS